MKKRTKKKSPSKLSAKRLTCNHSQAVDTDQAVARLKEAGFKITQARLSLLKALAKLKGPFTTDEMFHAGQKMPQDVKLDLVTVYRSLVVFEDLGLIARVDLGDGLVRYENKDSSGRHHHHHFICQGHGCHKIEPLDDCEIRKQEDILAKLGYTRLSHRLEFFGLCPQCSAKK